MDDTQAEAIATRGLAALREVLEGMRDDEQGGYPSRHQGRWGFVAIYPRVSAEQLDALFELAGIVPDEITTLGLCRDCKFSVNGRERGYAQPCAGCMRPSMSAFQPAAEVTRG